MEHPESKNKQSISSEESQRLVEQVTAKLGFEAPLVGRWTRVHEQRLKNVLQELGIERPCLQRALRQTLQHNANTIKEKVALAVLVDQMAQQEFPLFQNQHLIGAKEFADYTIQLGVSRKAAWTLYQLLCARHMGSQQPWKRASRTEMYLALHAIGWTRRDDIIRAPTIALVNRLGLAPYQATVVKHHVLRNIQVSKPIEFVSANKQSAEAFCCPPYSDPQWEGRYDFFGEDSRLTHIVQSLKEQVQQQIKKLFTSFITDDVKKAARDFGVGDASLFDTKDPNKFPFFGSREAIQTIIDLNTKTSKDEVVKWLQNIRLQTDQIRDKLRVVGVDTIIINIPTGMFGTGAPDPNGISINIFNKTDGRMLMNATPEPKGVTDALAEVQCWRAIVVDPIWQTQLPSGATGFQALDVGGLSLSYNSVHDNDWSLDYVHTAFRYDVNPHSRLLTADQREEDVGPPGGEDVFYADVKGWVVSGWTYPFTDIRGDSKLANTQSQFNLLMDQINDIQAATTLSDLDNIYLVKGDCIIKLLADGAVHTKNGEHALARSVYFDILNTLSTLKNPSPFDLELLFAVHVLLARSFEESKALPQAYGQLIEAYRYVLPGDQEDCDYLWLRLATLFLQWGDQLYAAAGNNYEKRLTALNWYQKIVEPGILLTYADGAEDEIQELWIDLACDDGSLPADVSEWMQTISVSLARFVWAQSVGIQGGSASGLLLAADKPIPIRSYEVLETQEPRSALNVAGRLIRVWLDISEVRVTRQNLKLRLAISDASFAQWRPTHVRVQAQYATYNPNAERSTSTFRGQNRDIVVFSQEIGTPNAAPSLAGLPGMRYWYLDLSSQASAGARLLPAPDHCITELLKREAQLRIDQIRAHLNVFGIHDEYVPNGRFQSLNRLAMNLADRASQFYAEYLGFLNQAEAATLNDLEVAHMQNLSEANIDSARKRIAQANIDLDAANAGVHASVELMQNAQSTLQQFQSSYQSGLVRALGSLQIGLPSFNIGIGGSFIGAISGADGYDSQFRTRELDYEGAVIQRQAQVDAADFRRRLAEIEVLIAEDSLAIEEMRGAYLNDRLRFLQNRTLTATYWYQIASLYRELAESQLKTAARWAWMAERALEFETNIPVSIVRMDYHLLTLGAERLRSDLDQLVVILAEFRERYRDVPNIIEREFRFSVEFPEQFRALTSLDASPPAESLSPGVRSVEFATTMQAFDKRLPGRYAFGRVLGVEVELQTDIAPNVFSGHVENARVTRFVQPDGSTRRIQSSASLVRVPIPISADSATICPPTFDLDNSGLHGEFSIPRSVDPEMDWEAIPWEEFRWEKIPGIGVLPSFGEDRGDIPILPGIEPEPIPGPDDGPPGPKPPEPDIPPEAHGVPGLGGDPPRRMPDRAELQKAQQMIESVQSLVDIFWEPHVADITGARIVERNLTDVAKSLSKRASRAGVSLNELQYCARLLVSDSSDPNPDIVLQQRRYQLKELSSLVAYKFRQVDLPALLTLRGHGEFVSQTDYQTITLQTLTWPARRTWERYEFHLEQRPIKEIYRDLTPGHGAIRRYTLDILPDYVTYPKGITAYGLKLKQHDAESLTLSTFSRRDDIMVFNPYHSDDQLGVFENTGIASDWRFTLRAMPLTSLHRTPQWDRIRDIVFRVWYHAAYERHEGFSLAEVIEPQAIQRDSEKILDISFYRDFYDEFRTLVGDFDPADPVSLAAARSFSDVSHAALGGWIPFRIEESLVPEEGHRISAALLVFRTEEPSTFPNYHWKLRYEDTGPVFQGEAIGDAGALAAGMSQERPVGFAGLDPRATWYFQLSTGDNPGLSLAPIQDIEFVLEFESI